MWGKTWHGNWIELLLIWVKVWSNIYLRASLLFLNCSELSFIQYKPIKLVLHTSKDYKIWPFIRINCRGFSFVRNNIWINSILYTNEIFQTMFDFWGHSVHTLVRTNWTQGWKIAVNSAYFFLTATVFNN